MLSGPRQIGGSLRLLDTPEWKQLVEEQISAPRGIVSRTTWSAASLKAASSDAADLVGLVETADLGQARLAHRLLIDAERAGRVVVSPELKAIWIARFFERESGVLSAWFDAPSSDSLWEMYDRVICHLPPGTRLDQVVEQCGAPTSGDRGDGISQGPSCHYATEDADAYIGADVSGVVVGMRYA